MREPEEYETQVDLGALGCDQDVRVWFYYSPYQPGRYSGPPENCYPDEPAEVDVSKFEWKHLDKWYELPYEALNEDCRQSIETAIIEMMEDARAEAAAEAYERAHSCDYTDDWP